MGEMPSAVSVVMRSYNEAHYLRGTLEQLFAQAEAPAIELIVIDSGSTDGSHEVVRAFGPAHFVVIDPYVPGVVLNQGARLASHDWIVYLNADATPANEHWLRELLTAAQGTPNCGAAFSRQVPRPDCWPVHALDYERCFGSETRPRESASWEHFFSMVSCVVNRTVWAAQRFREDLQYAEDDEWSRRLKAQGYAVAFAERSVAIHSHNYTPAQAYKRARGDALAIARAGHAGAHPGDWLRDVLVGSARDLLRDRVYCARRGCLGHLPLAARVRYQQRLGRLHGRREGLGS